MAELGSGGGSDYPGSLDTDTIKEVDNSTLARADVPNDSNAAIVAIENELGTDPAGTKADVKTYLQVEHETDGTHGAITPTSVTTGSISTDGTALKTKVVDIGDWDMDAAGDYLVAHGLTAANIRSISGVIRNDAKDTFYTISQSSGIATSATNELLFSDNGPPVRSYDANNIYMTRFGGGTFDTADFDDVGGAQETRGWITITYEA